MIGTNQLVLCYGEVQSGLCSASVYNLDLLVFC